MLKPEFISHISEYPDLAPLAHDLLTLPEVSIRYNLDKGKIPEDAIDIVPWCPEGRYLSSRPSFTQDPALHQGRYYVQDASSMAISAAIRDLLPYLGKMPRVLDSCAAPGGKTTAALSVLPVDSLVVANEYDFRRAEILAENVAKWGVPNTVVARGDTAKLNQLPDFFDLVIVDAPCSGEGMMRKDEQARQQWSLALVEKCSILQREILDNAWQALRPGGCIIYSTCTFNRTENERNVQWLMSEYAAESIPLETLEANKDIVPAQDIAAHCYHFFPGRVRGEGLFMAALHKPVQLNSQNKDIKIKSKFIELGKKETQIVSQFLKGDFKFYTLGEDVFAIPSLLADDMLKISSKLDILSMGIWIATIKGKDIFPAQPLALATSLDRNAFVNYEVDCSTAIDYLQRQAINVDAPKGYVLLTYKDLPLGFIKNLGNRCNNLYPKNWRIRSNY